MRDHDDRVGGRWVRSIHGLAVECHTSGPWGDALASWFEGWSREPADRLLGHVRERRALLPPHKTPIRVTGFLSHIADGEERWIVDASGAVAHIVGRTANVGGPFTENAVDRLTHSVLAQLATHGGLQLIHAGLLIPPDTRDAYLVLGRTGQGKSTLCASAQFAGWRVESDDAVLVGTERGRPVSAGVPGRMYVPENALPEGAGGWDTELDDRARRRSLVPTRPRGFHPVAGIILVRHGQAARSELVRATPAATVKALIGAAFLGHDPAVTRAWLPVAARLAAAPSWRLHHGTDASARLDAGRRVLTSIIDRAA